MRCYSLIADMIIVNMTVCCILVLCCSCSVQEGRRVSSKGIDDGVYIGCAWEVCVLFDL